MEGRQACRQAGIDTSGGGEGESEREIERGASTSLSRLLLTLGV